MTTNDYLTALTDCLAALRQEEDVICRAAVILAKATAENRLIHLFATEPHTAILEGELFFRCCGLVNINPIYDPAFDLSHGAYRCALCQSLDGLVSSILGYYENIENGDPMVLLTNNPLGALPTEAMQWAKAKGLTVILISPFQADSFADITINTHAKTDRTIHIETAAMATALNILSNKTLQALHAPVTWQGEDAVDINKSQALIDQYLYRVKHL